MAPTPPLPQGVPQWVGGVLVGVSAMTIAGATMATATNLYALNLQLAEQKKTLELLCDFMEEKKQLDKSQDERLRQIELRLHGMGR